MSKKVSYTMNDLGPELAEIYREYSDLTRRLEAGEISPQDALAAIERLEVVDRYGGRWSIYPEHGTFTMVDSHGVKHLGVNPRSFQPRPTGVVEVESEVVLEEDSAGRVTVRRKRSRLWLVVALLGGLGLGFVGGVVATAAVAEGGSGDGVGVVEAVERPRLGEGEGPSADRVNYVVGVLVSGKVDSFGFVVEDVDEGRALWVSSVVKLMSDSGFKVRESRDGGVSVLQVVNTENKVVMQGDLEWVQNGSGEWVLKSLPVMTPKS